MCAKTCSGTELRFGDGDDTCLLTVIELTVSLSCGLNIRIYCLLVTSWPRSLLMKPHRILVVTQIYADF